MIIVIQTLAFLGLVAVSLLNPPLGGLGLLFGYVVGDKFFALINIAQLIHFPIFITEPVLIILFVRAVIVSFRSDRFSDWQLNWASPWLWFYGIGFMNILFGFLLNGLISVFRDAVIVFYGVVTQIAVTYVRNLRDIKSIFFVVLGGLIIRLILELFFPIFDHGSSTFGLYSAMVTFACLCTLPLWKRAQPLAVAVILLFVGFMTSMDIRTVWVSFILTFFIAVGIEYKVKIPRRVLTIGIGSVFSSIFLTLIFLKAALPNRYAVIKWEFFTMFAGKDSPNLLTRVAMWEDAIEAVVPASGRLFKAFDRRVLNPYYYGSKERPGEKEMDEIAKGSTRYIGMDPSATDILVRFQKSGLLKNPPSWLKDNSVLRLMFGVPFGQPFVPERISAIHQVNRYDPHNSFIALLYRTGLLGFILFLAIIGSVFLKAFKALRSVVDPEQKYILLAVITCWIYHLGHSMTDVTLENPFRGIPFWLLLGLMMAMTNMIHNEKPADADPSRT